MTSDTFVIAVSSVWMIVGAVIDGWKLKVPNRITFPMIVCGWIFWAYWGGLSPLGVSLAGAFIAGGLLLPIYAIGGMGAGDVKLYAGFGAWVVPLEWFGYKHLLWAFAYSVILGGVLALLKILWAGTWYVNLENAREILSDLQTSGSVVEISERAAKRKSRLQLLPYGVPLTIGSLCYLGYIVWADLM